MRPERVFKAMADGTRRRVLAVLRRHELSVSELVNVLNQPQSTVSRHLKVLRDAELIRDRRNGSTVIYSVPVAPTNGQDADLTGQLIEWAAEQTMPAALGGRLETVVRRRGDMSRRFFGRVGRRWDTLREESFGSWFHLEAVSALLPREWTVADVGTGTGYLLPVLARQFHRVIGVELEDAMLDAARERVTSSGLENVDLRPGDLSQLPISDAGVDVAIAMLVLHHVPVPRDALNRWLHTRAELLSDIHEPALDAAEPHRVQPVQLT